MTGTLALLLALVLPGAAPIAPQRQVPATTVAVPSKPTLKKKKRKKKKKKKTGKLPKIRQRVGRFWLFTAPLEAEFRAGGSWGWKNRDVAGTLTTLAVDVTPGFRYQRGRFRIRAPLHADLRETYGFSLRRAHLRGGLDLSGRPTKLVELGAEFAIGKVWRPDWPDEYQPLLDRVGSPVGLHTTDRYGFLSWSADGRATWAHKGGDLRLKGGFLRRNNEDDSGWDPLLEPTHLVPLDRDVWRVALRSRLQPTPVLDLRFTARAKYILNPEAHARDALTGKAHAALGGVPANPRQRFTRVDGEARFSAWVKALRSRIVLRFGTVHNEDLYEGYYSWNTLLGSLDLRVRPLRQLYLKGGYQIAWRRYTSDGYRAGDDHPPLDNGESRRMRLEQRARGEIGYSLMKRALTPFVQVSWVLAEDNFPDYQPYIFPDTRAYRIDFDVHWVRVMGGIRVRL